MSTVIDSSSGRLPTSAHFLDADQCAERYAISKSTWLRLVDAGEAPRPTRFRRLVRWPEAVLKAWEEAGCPRANPSLMSGTHAVKGGSHGC